MIAIHKDGRIVSRSKNMRGIMRYPSRLLRDHPLLKHAGAFIRSVHVLGTEDGGALLRVRWSDGAYAVAKFASLTTARRFVQARRYWPAARITMPHEWARSLRA